jgi:hypothetical protein
LYTILEEEKKEPRGAFFSMEKGYRTKKEGFINGNIVLSHQVSSLGNTSFLASLSRSPYR